MERHADGTIDAVFRYEGTTCTNMGRPLRFSIASRSGRATRAIRFGSSTARRPQGDDGHTYMCRYMSNREHLLVAIDRERPLVGQPLNDVLGWDRPASGAGCYCEPDSREHKWGLVLETIHFALAREQEE